MRHKKKRLQFNRFTSWRKATLKSLVRSLFIYQSIKTTRIKALAAKQLADKLISLAKDNSLSAKRDVFKVLGSHRLVNLLFSDIGPRFNNRIGGFTRILNVAARRGDNAQIAILELAEIKKRELKHPRKKEEIKEDQTKPEISKKKPLVEEKKTKIEAKAPERPPVVKKVVPKKFLGGLRNIFKKERDSL